MIQGTGMHLGTSQNTLQVLFVLNIPCRWHWSFQQNDSEKPSEQMVQQSREQELETRVVRPWSHLLCIYSREQLRREWWLLLGELLCIEGNTESCWWWLWRRYHRERGVWRPGPACSTTVWSHGKTWYEMQCLIAYTPDTRQNVLLEERILKILLLTW